MSDEKCCMDHGANMIRLSEVEKDAEAMCVKLETTTSSLERTVILLDSLTVQVHDLAIRVRDIEMKPVKEHESYKGYIITAILAAIVGLVLGQIGLI